jgi:cell division protein FtsB
MVKPFICLRWSNILALALLGVSVSAHAQTARSGGAPNAQLMQQMQQLASERTTLQAENAKLKKELDDVRKDRDALKKGQAAGDQRTKASMAALAQSKAQQEAAEGQLKQSKDKMQELIAKFKETIQQLRQTETDATTTKQTLAVRDRDLKACVDRNKALYALNQEVLTRLEHQSMWSRAAASEPFTRIKRVQLENLTDDYKARADDQREPSTVPPSSSAPPPK